MTGSIPVRSTKNFMTKQILFRKLVELFPAERKNEIRYFLMAKNTFIGNELSPFDLINTDPERILSLAHAYLHPEDVF
jgi:hypothetical protein